ncbi:hypothetical protein K435DRAFT_974947 [Dendrothele bispora CBS 962.96]|uniref:Uncharacterized protein n=1 Tax=Dendrothele bispora (strain CBS 962.96) TaxID=1314807 RepID=A0A4V6T4U2_DENBC|nr:hypothetical protein K435DRAFT_974947 [Dendrothele bispora CBS 962.96]
MTAPIPMSAPSLPPIRPASEQQAAQRKRAATVPGKSMRTHSTSEPEVVACHFCRGLCCIDAVPLLSAFSYPFSYDGYSEENEM